MKSRLDLATTPASRRTPRWALRAGFCAAKSDTGMPSAACECQSLVKTDLRKEAWLDACRAPQGSPTSTSSTSLSPASSTLKAKFPSPKRVASSKSKISGCISMQAPSQGLPLLLAVCPMPLLVPRNCCRAPMFPSSLLLGHDLPQRVTAGWQVDGTVLQGMKIEAVMDRRADNVSLDLLSRVLVDIQVLPFSSG